MCNMELSLVKMCEKSKLNEGFLELWKHKYRDSSKLIALKAFNAKADCSFFYVVIAYHNLVIPAYRP